MSKPPKTGQLTQKPSETIDYSAAPKADTPQPDSGGTVDFSVNPIPSDPTGTVDLDSEQKLNDTSKQPKKPALAATFDSDAGAQPESDFLTEGNLFVGGKTLVKPGGDGESGASGPERPTVAGYEILGELGRGGMGVVYKALQKKLNRIVALKMVLAGAHAGKDQLARFNIEAQAVAHLQHPNIIQIYEVGEHTGLPYFSLEFVDGGSLSDKTEGKPQEPLEAADLIERLARAMQHAHEHGIVHRDLKPMNVLLMRDGTPKITDFGLAKRLEGESSSQTRSGAILGTPSYMAPEQAMGEIEKIGPLTDVYSLGAMLYELVTGRPPFLAATPMDTVIQVTKDEPVPPTQLQPKLPRDVETICLKCLQKEQPKRYASAGELADDLHRFLQGEPILARPVSTPERLWRWCRRNPVVASLSGVAVALFATVAIGSPIAALIILHQKELAVDAQKRAERNEKIAREKEQIAVAAKEQEEIARQKAEEEKQRADANALTAVEQGSLAVDSLYKVVTRIQNRLVDKPGLRQLRQEILNEAFDGLKRVVDTPESSSLVSRTKAAAYQSLGDIALQLGEIEQALEQFKQMHAILLAAVKLEPENPLMLRNLAISYARLAEVSDRRGQTADALELYKQCLVHRERWAAIEPNNPLAEQAIGEAFSRLGRLYLLSGDTSTAHGWCLKSLKIREAWVETEPENELARRELANLYSILGEVSVRLEDVSSARDYSQKYVQQYEELAIANPESAAIAGNLAVAYVRVGDLSIQLNDNDLAREYYGKALPPFRRLLEEDSENAPIKRNLSIALCGLGIVCQRAGDLSAARENFTEGLELRRQLAARAERDVRAQTDLMLILPRCGNHAEAAVIAERLYTEMPDGQKNLYNIACCYALCFAAAGSDDSAQRDVYETAAIKALKNAVERGYRALGQLQTDPDLDAIRERPEFQYIVERLKNMTGN